MPVFEVRAPGGTTYSIERGEDSILIGRSRHAHICLELQGVSRNHVRIQRREGKYFFEDLKSRNGTFLNGSRKAEGRLEHGDELGVGVAQVSFYTGHAGKPAAVPAAIADLPEAALAPEEEPGPEEARVVGWVGELPFWGISALLHLILFSILYGIILQVPEKEKPTSLRIRQLVSTPDPYDPAARRDIVKRPRIPFPKMVRRPIIERKLDEVTPEIPKGSDLNRLTNVELLGRSFHDAIGVGGGAAGAYGERWGKGSLIREGGSEATESAVRAALEWLRRHQSPDGSWKASDFVNQCKKVCRNKNPRKGDGRGPADYDVGVTGLAMLAFTGYGHTHQHGIYPEYVDCLRRAVRFLKSVQDHSGQQGSSGRYGPTRSHWPYNHSIATMAMAELLVMSRDVIGLRRSVEEATELILYMQNPGRGWRYGVRNGENDVSVTGWMILALKTARSAQLGIPRERFAQAFRDAMRFINATTDDRGITGYQKRGNSRTRMPCMTSVGVLSRIFAGESRASSLVRKGVELCVKETPRWDERERGIINLYHWYYASYALFQFGGKAWERWNEPLQQALLPSQRRGGDEDGSWDPVGDWGPRGGRVYSTAIGAMTLEVYYRFRRIRDGYAW